MIRALTVRQPWASDIVDGVKTIEVRSRHTHHRGPLVIHASARPDDGSRELVAEEGLPLAALV